MAPSATALLRRIAMALLRGADEDDVVDDLSATRRRRAAAARKYRPEKVDPLLIAEAAPSAPDRYFYFERVAEQDSLFRYVASAITGRQPTRENKPELLAELRDRGVFLIDLKLDPVDRGPLREEVPGLVRRAASLDPARVILIKASVYDAAFGPLREAGLPVVDVRVPFPGSGRQREFERQLAEALGQRSV